MPSLALLLALLLSAPARAAEDPVECPAGTERRETRDPLNPWTCESLPGRGLRALSGAKGFAAPLRCPKGTHEVAALHGLQPFRCVSSGPAEPSADDAAEASPRQAQPTRFNSRSKPARRYRVPGELSFEYPGEFRLRDEWREDPPTLYLLLDQGAPGKPVSISVARAESGQSTWLELDAALAREMEWQGALDSGKVSVAGRPARAAEVPGASRTVYLPLSKDSYYSFVYSAPAELFERHRGSFERVLKSLKLEAR